MIEALTGLALGLAGSLHCVGMCGPIAIALPGKRKISWSMSGQKFIYQMGRVATYTVLGLLTGLAGSSIVSAGFTQHLSIIAGALMVTIAVLQLTHTTRIGRIPILDKLSNVVERLIARKLSGSRPGYGLHFMIGLFNGLLPCGLVLSALVGSLGTGDPLQGSLFMALFGLGTVPLMMGVAILGGVISCKLRHSLRKAAPVLAIVIGAVFMLRGLSLDIPYMSPVLEGPKPSCCQVH